MRQKTSYFTELVLVVIIGIMFACPAFADEKLMGKSSKLLAAMRKGDNVGMKTLVENNPQLVNFSRSSKGHPLIYTAFCELPRIPDQLSAILLFLEHGASLKGELGRRCLNCAIMDDNKSLVELLLEHGADPSLKVPSPPYQKEMTAVEFAEQGKHKEIIDIIKNHINK